MVERRRRRGWDAWRALRDREHVLFGLGRLPDAVGGGVSWPCPDGYVAVILDHDLTREERHAVLAHELVHDELGGGVDLHDAPAPMRTLLTRLERRVVDEVARRLIPPDDLRAYCDIAAVNELPVEVWSVAEFWDTTEDVARRALELLRAS